MIIVERPPLFRILPRVQFTIRSACEYEVAEARILGALSHPNTKRAPADKPLCGTFQDGDLSALVVLPPGDPRTKVRARLGVTDDGRAALQGDIRPPLEHLLFVAAMAGVALVIVVTSTLAIPGWLMLVVVTLGTLAALWLATWSSFPRRVLRTRSVLQRVLREPVSGENACALPAPSSAYRARQPRSRLILRHRTRS